MVKRVSSSYEAFCAAKSLSYSVDLCAILAMGTLRWDSEENVDMMEAMTYT